MNSAAMHPPGVWRHFDRPARLLGHLENAKALLSVLRPFVTVAGEACEEARGLSPAGNTTS